MTYKQFMKSFRKFLESSKINLKNNTSGKQKFIQEAMNKLDHFLSDDSESKPKLKTRTRDLFNNSVLCLKPQHPSSQKRNTHVSSLADSQKADDLVQQRKRKREDHED